MGIAASVDGETAEIVIRLDTNEAKLNDYS